MCRRGALRGWTALIRSDAIAVLSHSQVKRERYSITAARAALNIGTGCARPQLSHGRGGLGSGRMSCRRSLLLARYGRTWGWFGAADLLVTNLVTLVSEFVALRVGLAYFHLGAPIAVIGGLLLVVLTLTGGRYRRWERIVLGLALFNGLFLVAAIMVRPDPATVGMAFLTWSPLPTGSTVTLLFLLTATIGATVTPWMVFFQQGASADKGMTSSDLKHGRIDTAIGGGLAAIFGCAALVVGATLFGHGGTGIQGMAGAGFPAVFGAHSGGIVGGIFAIGLIQAGAVAILTISAYAAGEAAGISHSFNATPRAALPFYAVNILSALIAGGVILIPGIPLLSIALNANILATVLLPVTLIFLLMLANDRQLMGPWANKRSSNITAITVIVIISVCAAGYAIASLLQTLHLFPA